MLDSDISALLWLLFSIIAVLILACWATRRIVGGIPASHIKRTGRQIEILAQTAIGKSEALILVQAGVRCFLLGVTANAITVLAEFTEEETAILREKPKDQENGGKPGFIEVLQKSLKQQRR